MPTVFWGEMYANFGLPGVLIAPFFVGIALYGVDHVVNKAENTPLKIGLVVWLIIHYQNLSATGLSGFIFDFYLIAVLGLVIGDVVKAPG
jgi:F0F1-type ATP synthase membrane subunit a